MYREELGHVPVLLKEVLNLIKGKKIKRVLDCTIGAGGHALEILNSHPEIEEYIGIDLDEWALKRVFNNIKDSRLKTYNMNFFNISEDTLGKFDFILFDLGVSSMQLDEGERGFSFMNDGPLDMRMNLNQKKSAFTVVNNYSKDELKNLFTAYEVKFANRIIDSIFQNRPIRTTKQLADIIKDVTPKIKSKIHPATLAFQAIRMIVNNEERSIRNALIQAFSMLEQYGIIAVISFHSIEDRIAKYAFKYFSGKSEASSDPITGNRTILGKDLFKKPIVSSDEELKFNNRSRSAKLRAIQKI